MTTVGSIEYVASIDFTQMIADQRRIESGLNQTASNVNTLSRATDNASAAFGRLKTMALSVAGALAAREVLAYADAWTKANNKLANSVLAHETQAEVMGRVFDISQRTATSLDATATLYQRLAASAEQMGMTGQQLGAVTETINKSFAVSGASAAEASGAIVQLGQALGAGALRGEEFNSVNEAAPRLMKAIADEMGVARGELKSYAAAGLITSDIVIAAISNQGDAIDAEYAKMSRTLEQNTQIAKNNAMQWVGSSGTVQAASKAIGSAFVTLSQNLDEVVLVGSVVASVMGGKLVQATYGYIAAQVSAIQTTAAANAAELQRLTALEQEAIAATSAARANVQLAESAVVAATAAVNDARAQQALAVTEWEQNNAALALSVANQRLATAEAQVATAGEVAAVAMTNQSAATAAAGAAASSASVSMGVLRGAMALLGGPAGVIMIAASAMMYFASKSNSAAESVSRLSTELEQATRNVKNLSKAQAQGQLAEWKNKLDEANASAQDFADQAEKAAKAVDQLQKYKAGKLSLGELNRSLDFSDMTIFYKSAADVEAQLVKYQREKEIALGKEAEARQQVVAIMKLQSQLGEQINAGPSKAAPEKDTKPGALPKDVQEHGERLRQALMTNRQKIQAEYDADIAMQTAKLEEIEKLRATAKGKALVNLDAQEKEIRAQMELAAKLRDKKLSQEGERETKAQDAQDKRNSRALAMRQRHYDKLTALEVKREAEVMANRAKIEETYQKHLSTINNLLVSGTQSEFTRLEAQKQINRQKLAEFDAMIASEENRNNAWLVGSAQFWEARAKIEADGEAALDKIKKEAEDRKQKASDIVGGVNQKSGTMASDLLAMEADRRARLAELAKLYDDADEAQKAEHLAKMTQLDAAYAQKEQEIMLASSEQMLSNAASNFESAFGKQSGAYKAAFIASKGFALAQGTIALYSAALTAMNDPTALTPAQKFANYAAVFAAGSNLIGTIASISYGGGKQYGGNVQAGSMYRMGEQGPEIFRGTSGKNYVIPGENGRVIPNDKIGGGGVVINIVNNAGADVTATASNDGKQIDIAVNRAVSEVSRQISSNTGQVWNSLKSSTNVQGKL